MASAVTLETSVAGDGTAVPRRGDAVTVHYVGTLVSDGAMFDSSRDKKTPFTFKLGGGGVIKGWNLGIAQMSLGQRATLSIPAELGYGAAGCEDKAHASGTGVIPPNADLSFDVEVLDINFGVTLTRYRSTLSAWLAGKLMAYDDDAEARVQLNAKHGGRDEYEAHLIAAAGKKFEAEVAKRAASAGVELDRIRSVATAAAQADLAPAVAPMASEGPVEVDGASDGLAAASIADGADAPSDGGVPAAANAPHTLQFDARFATFKVEPNDDAEARAPNFPRSLHNAAELFTHLGHSASAARMHACVMRVLGALAAGPDGKSQQRLGRPCVCWGCGHVGLPTNKCSEKAAKPAGLCAHCGDDSQTNFVYCVGAEGKRLPWIEAAPVKAEQQQAKVDEAAKVADAAELS